MNLQPNRLVVVESKEAKAKIKDAMYGNLLQLESSSAFIIITTNLNKFEDGNHIFDSSVEQGLMPLEVSNRQKAIIKDRNLDYDLRKTLNEGYLDAGLLAMQLMLVAKEHGYDTCPIAGFNKDTILGKLGINDKSIQPVLIISIGKGLDEGYPSYRIPVKDVTTYL